MPYSKLDELPEAVRGIPTHAQEIWMAAFNSSWDQYNGDEERCMATAWAAVKNKYHKEGDEWVEIQEGKLYAVILKEISSETSEFQLLPQGKIEIEGDGPAFVDEESARLILEYQRRRGNDMVIDYEHQTLKDVQAPAAGWIKQMIDKGTDGIWAVTDWTKRAKDYLINKEYRFFSPVIMIRAADRKVIAILNVALTNFPKINNLRPIIAKLEDHRSGFAAQARWSITDDQSIHNKRKEAKIMWEKLKKLLGLAADAVEEKVTEAVELLVNKVKTLETVVACKEVLEAIGAKADAKKEEVIQIIGSLKAPADVAKTLSLEVATLRKELNEIKQGDLVALALKEGKTSPEELDKWGRDLAMKNSEQFKIIVLSRPAGSVIPVDSIPPGPKDRDARMDETQISINKMMGISEETWKKYNAVKQ